MSKEAIAEFVARMKEQQKDQIQAMELPAGTEEYVQERIKAGDQETLVFMLKLGYVMGLQTGYAAQTLEQNVTTKSQDTIKAQHYRSYCCNKKRPSNCLGV